LANGLKSGYTYQMVGGTSVQGSIWTWSATAWPITYRSTGVRTYYIDESGIVRGEDIGGGIGTVAMPAVW